MTFFSREAARECRRKKKEYVRCLESRVAVLESQNQALIGELRALKELYLPKSQDNWWNILTLLVYKCWKQLWLLLMDISVVNYGITLWFPEHFNTFHTVWFDREYLQLHTPYHYDREYLLLHTPYLDREYHTIPYGIGNIYICTHMILCDERGKCRLHREGNTYNWTSHPILRWKGEKRVCYMLNLICSLFVSNESLLRVVKGRL